MQQQFLPTHPAPQSSYRCGDLLGVRVDDISPDSIMDEICGALRDDRRLLVLNVNAHMLMLARRQSWLQEFLDRADLVFCDGAGIQLASMLLNRRNLHRSTPPEWAEILGRRLAPAKASVFWVGGAPGTVERAAQNYTCATGTRIAGLQHGFFDQRPGSPANIQLVDQINRAAPDLLFVNMGMPLQERWLADHWDQLNAKVAITAGALVDHLAGHVHRPPRWVANCGLEWAVRLAIEPKRLWRRYLLGLPAFGATVVNELLVNAIRRDAPARHETSEG